MYFPAPPSPGAWGGAVASDICVDTSGLFVVPLPGEIGCLVGSEKASLGCVTEESSGDEVAWESIVDSLVLPMDGISVILEVVGFLLEGVEVDDDSALVSVTVAGDVEMTVVDPIISSRELSLPFAAVIDVDA